MRPRRPAVRMVAKAARAQAKVPVRCTATIRAQASSGNASMGCLAVMPALFTRTSSRPKASRAVRTIASPAATVPTGSRLGVASPPAARISSTTAAATPVSAPRPSSPQPTSLTTTRAPAAASARAYARPSPRPAPVTIATRPASGCMRPATPGAPSPSTAWTRRNSPGRFRARTAPALRPRRVFLLYDASRPGGHLRRTSMARFRSTKRAKELQRKAKHEAKEVRKRERQERAQTGEADDDIDWSQAVGISPPPGAVADKADETGAEDEDEEEEEAER